MSERKPRAKKPADLDDNPVLGLLKKLAAHAGQQEQDREVDPTTFCRAVTETLRKGDKCPCPENIEKIDRVHRDCTPPHCRISLVKALMRIQCAEQVAQAQAQSQERASDEVLHHLTSHLAEAGRLYAGYWQAVSKDETGGKVH